MYKTKCFCPVCKKEIGEAIHPDQTMGGMGAALIFNDYRGEHASKSPACTRHNDWIKGWDTQTIKADE